MKSNTPDLDDQIRRALRAHDETADFDSLEEQNIFAQLFAVFRGRQRWLNLLGAVLQLVYVVACVYSALRFFDAETVRDQILFATAFLASLGVTMAFKIWFWMVLNRNSVLREVKRLELQVAHLSRGQGSLPGA